MLVPYSNLSPKSRVWIYQSERLIKSQEKKDIYKNLIDFCNNWTSHGNSLQCSFKIYDWFICIFVDIQSNPSGCSIDKSVAFMKQISHRFKINFFNRQNIIFKKEEDVKILSLEEFKLIIDPDLIIYNNMVTTKEDFELKWQLPVKDTWLNIFLK
tara:strand:- start:62 stop:526 length:465 start_codon:yes stop_codon:yes gene_type:complete